MDFSLIPAALSGIATSVGIAKAALEMRDFTQAGAAVADVTQKLLDLQAQVLVSNAAFMQLQQEHSSLAQRVRELDEARTDRERYTLFELAAGVFVYRSNVSPQSAGAENPSNPEPMHYLCPRCFDQKAKVILQLRSVHWHCSRCKTAYWSGRSVR